MRIIEDLKRYSGGSAAKALYHVLLNSNFQMIFWYRVANALSKIHVSPVSKIIMYFHKLIYACDIDYRADIGGGFRIVHGIGIVIGAEVVCGKNCTIYQGVNLGGNLGKKKVINGKLTGQPYLHDGVTLYAQSCVMGPVEINAGSRVGANAVITSDIPHHTVVYTKALRVEKTCIDQ